MDAITIVPMSLVFFCQLLKIVDGVFYVTMSPI
jgi:hypothetical protein